MRAYQAGTNHFLTKSADLSRLRLILASLYCGVLTGNDFSLLAGLPARARVHEAGKRHTTGNPLARKTLDISIP